MKTLYIECKMGAAGDMLTAALLELVPEYRLREVITKLQNIGLEGVDFSIEKTVKCGILGTHVSVKVNDQEEESLDVEYINENDEEKDDAVDELALPVQDFIDPVVSDELHHQHHHDSENEHEHEHHSLEEVSEIISKLRVSDAVKKDALAVYKLIARAESHVHGVEVSQIHFHEVGEKDAIMDVTAVCYLMNFIGAERIVASPVHVGSGNVRCAHGILPVPAPATEYLLRGIPYYQGDIKSELCTPTGAALLKYFAKEFGPMPEMNIEQTGVGCGNKDFETANCVRIFMGESEGRTYEDRILELDANVDDMTAEEIGFAMDRLFDAGAREVFTSSVYMKKNRPGTLITVICTEDKKDEILETFFKYTTTIGIRQKVCERYILKRETEVLKTEFGDIRKKTSSGYECNRSKLEYDDVAKIALEKGISLREARELIEKKIKNI